MIKTYLYKGYPLTYSMGIWTYTTDNKTIITNNLETILNK